MRVENVTGSSGWQAESVGPWSRHRRDLEGGRVLIVAPGLDGRWTWDLWAGRECGLCLGMPPGGFETAAEAKADADRAGAESAPVSDEELARRNGIDAGRGHVVLRLVTVGSGRRCVQCGSEIAPGIAAEQAEGEPWLWCGSCASRNPDTTVTGGTPVSA